MRALRLESAARNDLVLAVEKQADQGRGEERATVSCARRGACQMKSFHKMRIIFYIMFTCSRASISN